MIPAAVSLTHFEDKLYWADITKMAVVSVSKFEQTEPSVVWQMDVKPVTLRALHQVLQPSHGRGNYCAGSSYFDERMGDFLFANP